MKDEVLESLNPLVGADLPLSTLLDRDFFIPVGLNLFDEKTKNLSYLEGAKEEKKEVSAPDLLFEIFEQTVDRFPKNIAIKSSHRSITYSELDREANKIANALHARGIGVGDHVVLMMPRSESVYAVMLGILKAGAAYVPVDPEYPVDRVSYIAGDAGARVMITSEELKPTLTAAVRSLQVKCEILVADSLLHGNTSTTRLSTSQTKVCPTDLSYIIYTSGTTGRPKGCQIEHRNICGLIRSESKVFGIRSDDVVFQGFSLAFDASLEELWAAFAHGAALFVGTKNIIHSGHFLPKILNDAGVTVLSCVPTLLSMVQDDIPSVRILIFGGEACPPDLVARWESPGRVIYNTYGPTEATVVATLTAMTSDELVTIGRPIPNYKIAVVDESLNVVPKGREGELVIGGVGVARGYLNRPELNQEKFIETDRYSGTKERYYRTGDLVRLTDHNQIEFLGRADDQVKIRGFRVELSEIESLLLHCPGVLAAAAVFLKDRQQIAAYVVMRGDHKIDRHFVREYLSDKVPVFMVPAFLDALKELPTLTSGKVDRRALPPPVRPLVDRVRTLEAPASPLEEIILKAWTEAFGKKDISVLDHFFTDLGGHSLMAAQVINKLRVLKNMDRLGVADIYAYPSIRLLADHCQKIMPSEAEQVHADLLKHAAPRRRIYRTTNYRYVMAGVAQGLLMIPIAGIYAWEWLGSFFIYAHFIINHATVQQAIAASLISFLATIPATLIIGLVAKWALLGRIKPGKYPLWGRFYVKYWFVRTLIRALPVQFMAGTPFLNAYFRLLGMKIGRGVYLGSANISTFDTLTVGDFVTVGGDSSIDGASVEDGWLVIQNNTIGSHAWIGQRSILGGDNHMAPGSQLDDLSSLVPGGRIGRDQRFSGSPATHVGPIISSRHPARNPWNFGVTITLGVMVLMVPLMILVAVAPGLMVMTHMYHRKWQQLVWGAPLAAISFVISLSLLAVAIKWLFVGRLKEKVFPIASFYYARKWFVDSILNMSLEVTGTLYATLYLKYFLNLLGSNLGPRSEISTVRFLQPDLLFAGRECFLADDVSVGAPKILNGWIELRKVTVGDRTFVGNSAVLPGGTHLGNHTLIGVLSRPPAQNPLPDHTSWLGATPMLLPMRDESRPFSEASTYNPPAKLVALRYFVEFFRVIMPSTLFIMTSILLLNFIDRFHGFHRLWLHLAIMPFMYIAAGTFGILVVAALKRIVVGRYRVGQHPLWSHFVWRSELVTGVFENFAVIFLIDLLRGTPFLPVALRLFGMKIGKRCYVDTTWFTEFDLITVGDDAMLNEDANIQTHLFEDRVFKLGTVNIGNGCTVGTMTTVLYDTEMMDGSRLGDLSLLMKGEVLRDGTEWQGCPIRAR